MVAVAVVEAVVVLEVETPPPLRWYAPCFPPLRPCCVSAVSAAGGDRSQVFPPWSTRRLAEGVLACLLERIGCAGVAMIQRCEWTE